MTNAEFIRTLTDEELADLLAGMTWDHAFSCPVGFFPDKCVENNNNCHICYYQWLQMETGEGWKKDDNKG